MNTKCSESALLAEKARLERLVRAGERRVEHWLTRAERGFNFAVRAREKFKDASPQAKREFIADAFGSNLSLLNRNVVIAKKNELLIIKEALEDQPMTKPWFEPPKTQEIPTRMEDLFDRNPVLRARWDLNPRSDP